jgi:hypothetical protein
VALAVYWLLSGRSRKLPWRRMLAVASLIALGIGLNGWFLLPDVSYAHDTHIASVNVPWSLTGFMNTFGVIFDPLRTVPKNNAVGPAVYVQAPVLALVWGLIALPVVWREKRLRAGVATTLIVLGGLLVLIMSSAAWSLLPSFFQQTEFAFRLQTYVTLACAGLVLVGALALTRRAERGRAIRVDRRLAFGLGLAVAFGVSLAVWQLWVPNTHNCAGSHCSYSTRADALRTPPTLEPESWYEADDYGDHTLPVIAPASSWRFNPEAVKDDRLVSTFPANSGPIITNIIGGPYLVHVGGAARVVGRFRRGGYLTIERMAANAGPVEVSPQLSAPVVLGRITTAVSVALLLALAATAGLRWRRRAHG